MFYEYSEYWFRIASNIITDMGGSLYQGPVSVLFFKRGPDFDIWELSKPKGLFETLGPQNP